MQGAPIILPVRAHD